MTRRCCAVALAALIGGCGGERFGNGEVLRDDEAEQAARGVENFEAIIARHAAGDHAGRGAHARGLACARGTFTVAADLPDALRHGVFATPGRRYHAWIRFSNATPDFRGSDERGADAHGMAVKLLGVSGEPLERPASGQVQQDFLMTDHPVFFVRDIDDYNAFLAADPVKSFFFPSRNPLSWRWREFLIVKKMLKTIDTPLSQRYFSGTAYRLGPHRVKYAATPCTSSVRTDPANASAPDRLARNLAHHLDRAPVCFEFGIQRQRDDRYMPVEDATVRWDESVAPFVTAARIELPVQDVAAPARTSLCEDLAFAPWHALPAHRPLGQLNRMRRAMYRASSAYRHARNDAKIPVLHPDGRETPAR